MNSERSIIEKLNESRRQKAIREASFDANGKHYSSAFGHYSCDGQPISRDEYFKAQEGGSSDTSTSSEDNKDTTVNNADNSQRTPNIDRDKFRDKTGYSIDDVEDYNGYTIVKTFPFSGRINGERKTLRYYYVVTDDDTLEIDSSWFTPGRAKKAIDNIVAGKESYSDNGPAHEYSTGKYFKDLKHPGGGYAVYNNGKYIGNADTPQGAKSMIDNDR